MRPFNFTLLNALSALIIVFGGTCAAAQTKAAGKAPIVLADIQGDLPENFAIPTDVYWKRVHPHLLPSDHPAYEKMTEIFNRTRPIVNEETLKEAGFKILYRKPRSFIRVVRHPEIPGYLLKIYLDSELRRKKNKTGWEWLILRCEGAAKVRKGIALCKAKNFVVAQKWLFVVPALPAPPSGKNHVTQPLVLLVEDMQLAPLQASKNAWRHSITKQHLDELYQILSVAGGASLRPDNICLRRNGQFAFIDTEYPYKANYYDQVLPYINAGMRAYWQHLIQNKGPRK